MRLAEEEDEEAANGSPSLHRVSPSSLLVEMMEIQELQ